MKLTSETAKSVHKLLDLLKTKFVEGYELEDPPEITLFLHRGDGGVPVFDLKVTLAPPGHFLNKGGSNEARGKS